MYTPKYFQCENPQLIEEIIQRYPFGILVSKGAEIPFQATHIPFLLEKNGENYKLLTHFASMNPQSSMENETEVMVIFNGPHAYVSPTLYSSKEQVPTWDYIAVHIYGKAKMITNDADKVEILEKTISFFEPAYMKQWNEIGNRYKESLKKIMVAMTIEVEKIEATFKLSQNKPKQDIERIIAEFENTNPELALEMKRYYDENP
jgi:transcriptional regulator